MKKYKHVQTGMIAEESDSKELYIINGCTIHRKLIENTSDWVEIKPDECFDINDWVYGDSSHTKLIKLGKVLNIIGIGSNAIVSASEYYYINYDGDVVDSSCGGDTITFGRARHLKKATMTQIHNGLSIVAMNLGYEKDVWIKSITNNGISTKLTSNTFSLSTDNNGNTRLVNDNYVVYCNGVWAEIIEAPKEELKCNFGDVTFLIKNSKYCKTTYGDVTYEEIDNAIKYLQNPPKLAGHALTIHSHFEILGKYDVLTEIANRNKKDKYVITIGFGCESGTLDELIAIRKAMDSLKNTEFILPDAWYIIVTEENKVDVSIWRFEKNYLNYMLKTGDITGMHKLGTKEHDYQSDSNECKKNYGTEITYEQFKKYVLNK